MFIYTPSNEFLTITTPLQVNIYTQSYKINTNKLYTRSTQILPSSKIFFLINFFFKKKFSKIKNSVQFYKFFYLWITFFFKKFSDNLYILVKLYTNSNLVNFASKYNIIKPYQRLFTRSFKLYSYLLNIFHTIVKFKSLVFFQNFLKRFFKNVNFFKHKFLIFYIRKCIRALTTSVFKLYNINGLYLRLHGKIAKAGNSRKQKYLLRYNSISTNHVNNYLIEKFQIFTFTGSIGCTILLSIK